MELRDILEILWKSNSLDYNSKESSEIVTNIVLLACSFLSIIAFGLNLRVISIVLTMPTEKRIANILVAHLSFVNILLNYFVVVLLLSRNEIWPLENTYGLCVGHAYFRNAIVSLIPINVTAIAYQKLKILKPTFTGEKLIINRTVVFMWTIVLVGSCPNLFTTTYISPAHPNTDGQCTLQPIMESLPLTVGFELVRLLLYHVLPTAYILYALIFIRRKVSKYLFVQNNKITSAKLKSKVRKVRLIVLNGLGFILIWIPTVVILFYYKIYIRSGETLVSVLERKAGFHFFVMVILGYVYIMLNPLIHLHLDDDLGDMKWYSITFRRENQDKNTTIEMEAGENTHGNHEVKVDQPNGAANLCDSRESTFQQSTATN